MTRNLQEEEFIWAWASRESPCWLGGSAAGAGSREWTGSGVVKSQSPPPVITSPNKATLLGMKQYHQLRTKHPHIRAFGGHSNYHTPLEVVEMLETDCFLAFFIRNFIPTVAAALTVHRVLIYPYLDNTFLN